MAETRENRNRTQSHHHGLSFDSLKGWWKRCFLEGNLGNTASPPVAAVTNWIRETAV